MKESSDSYYLYEEPVQLKIKPSDKPIKQDIESAKIDNAKNSRLQAYRMMKKRVQTKEEITNFSRINDEQLNKEMHQNIYYGIDDKPSIDKKELSLLNQFEEYYKEKLKPDNITNISAIHNIKNKNEFYEMKIKYILGATIGRDSICYHKKDKWIVYINQNMVIKEDISEEENRSQIILSDSKYNLDVVKISDNGNYLMAYFYEKLEDRNKNVIYPSIYFWEIQNSFKFMNKLAIKHGKIVECEFSPMSNLCLVISNNIIIKVLTRLMNHLLAYLILKVMRYLQLQ
jgi:hypothetical protein